MLYLVPTSLSANNPIAPLLPCEHNQIKTCTTWLVENPKPARAHLALLGLYQPIQALRIVSIDSTNPTEIETLLRAANPSEPVGLISDAGCPCIADPGAKVVYIAHTIGCPVHPLVGPSSLILALMGSGLGGQQFTFHGYLPIDAKARHAMLHLTEAASAQNKHTQLAIETPYRNGVLLDAMLDAFQPNTMLCLALNLQSPNAWIKTHNMTTWAKLKKTEELPNLHKQPCVFVWKRD